MSDCLTSNSVSLVIGEASPANETLGCDHGVLTKKGRKARHVVRKSGVGRTYICSTRVGVEKDENRERHTPRAIDNLKGLGEGRTGSCKAGETGGDSKGQRGR